MKGKSLFLATLLSGCLRSANPQATILEEDKSIIFPEFDTELPTVVGAKGYPYELDGVTLRAITVAANDYNPPGSQTRDCWHTQEAQEYRVIRRGDIIFVRISANPSYCEMNVMLIDNGLRYAISLDGRILRRLGAGEPDGSRLKASDAGVREPLSEPVPNSLVGNTEWGGPGFIPPQWLKDGGSPGSLESQPRPAAPLDVGSPGDGGSWPVPAR
jgi:hypothetical protein